MRPNVSKFPSLNYLSLGRVVRLQYKDCELVLFSKAF